MDQINDIFQLRDLIPYPVFTAQNGAVEVVNQYAEALLIVPGTPVENLIAKNVEEYRNLTEDTTVALEFDLEGYRIRGTVTRRQGQELFLLDSQDNEAVQLTLSTASTALRMPLQHIFSGLQDIQLFVKPEDPELQKYLRQITKGAYEALRLATNMSDVTFYSQSRNELNAVDLTKELGEAAQKAAALLEQVGIKLNFSSSIPDKVVLANRQKMERALHNLILNAATYRSQTEEPWIRVELKEVNDQIHLSVTDNGLGIRDDVFATLFTRYLRQPSLDNRGFGLGQGLPLVRTIANSHGGTVLVERLNPSGTRVTMTIRSVSYDPMVVCSNRFPMDYASDFDHALTELSTVLPNEAFTKL